MTIFDPLPPQNPHPLTDHQKIVRGDYVGGPYNCAKNWCKFVRGGLLGKWVKHNESTRQWRNQKFRQGQRQSVAFLSVHSRSAALPSRPYNQKTS